MIYVYITFLSVNDALDFEILFKKKIKFILVPVPRKISESCGVAARLSEKDYRNNISKIKNSNIIYKNIHKILE